MIKLKENLNNFYSSADKKYIQILAVTPANPEELYHHNLEQYMNIHIEEYQKLPYIYTKYYNNINLKVFFSKKPLKMKKTAANEFEVKIQMKIENLTYYKKNRICMLIKHSIYVKNLYRTSVQFQGL